MRITGQTAKRSIDMMVNGIGWERIADGMKREMMEDEYRAARKAAREQLGITLMRSEPERFRAEIIEELSRRIEQEHTKQ